MEPRPHSLPGASLSQRVQEIFSASEHVWNTQGLDAGRRNSAVYPGDSPDSTSPEFSPTGSDWGSFAEDNIILVSEEENAQIPSGFNQVSEEFQVLPLIEKRKRGRRPIRPFDPVKKKTEEKDKYWLRAFRAYMKSNFTKLKKTMSAEERFFWRQHLSPEGKPEKGNRYLSYGKQYKNALFSDPSFVRLFQQWFLEHGEEELKKKCARDSALWFVFYDYGSKELFNYNPNCPSPQQDSGSVSPDDRASPEPPDVPMAVDYDITMVEGVDDILDNF